MFYAIKIETFRKISNNNIYIATTTGLSLYDKENDNYLRYNNKNKHIDNLTDKQVTATNIIVVKMSKIDYIFISHCNIGFRNWTFLFMKK